MRLMVLMLLTAGMITGSGIGRADAQTIGLQHGYISNSVDDFARSDQPYFNPQQPVYAYVVLTSNYHNGFNLSLSCQVSVATTGQNLGWLSTNIWVQAGHQNVRTDALTLSWPAAAVNLTCVPNGNPGLGVTRQISPATWGMGVAAAPAPTPQPVYQPTPQPVYQPVPQPVYVPVPVAAQPTPTPQPAAPPATCQSVLLEMGHSATDLIFCDGVPNDCAVQMLRAGNSPTDLIFCD
ncbi:MAG: hypothetical protein KC561_10065 [Myxococcales bacterium]|nr:hypothetical protein [Myxococcales bacterium]